MRRIIAPVVVSVAAHALLLAGYVAYKGGHVGVLVCVGESLTGRFPYEAIRSGRAMGFGYDGQFYYAIARSPWQRHQQPIDAPPVRHLRILYPAVCWLLSGGHPYALLWVMPLVNLLAIGGLTAFGAVAARRQGLSPWWGLLLPLVVNAWLASLRNLTDVTSVLCVCGLLCAWGWNWPAWSIGLWATAALFSREQNLLVVLWVLSVGVWQQRRAAVAVLVVAILAWLDWVLILRHLYGVWPFLPTRGNFAPKVWGVPTPFWGLTYRWARPAIDRDGLTNVAASLMITWELVLVARLLIWGRDPVLRLAALAGAALAILSGPAIYEDYWSYLRVLTWMPLALWLSAVQERQRAIMVLLALPVVVPRRFVPFAGSLAGSPG